MSHQIEAGALLDKEFSPRQWFIAPLLAPGSLGMVHAPSGVGKTLFVQWLATAAVSRGRFLKWQSERFGRLLYLDGEMGQRMMRERLIGLLASAKFQVPKGHVYILSYDQFKAGHVPNIGDERAQGYYSDEMKDRDILVIDNLSTCLHQSDKQTDLSSWLPVQRWLTKLRGEGKCVILVHHSGKSGDQLGTSAKQHILDWVINLKRPADYRSEDGARFLVVFEKARGFQGAEAETISVRAEYLEGGRTEWSWSTLSDSADQSIAEMRKVGMTPMEIANSLGMSIFQVKRRLKNADFKEAAHEDADDALW